jgi:activator of HSP90 ATPase
MNLGKKSDPMPTRRDVIARLTLGLSAAAVVGGVCGVRRLHYWTPNRTRANVRIVQAWRSGTWDPGIYSIARFALAPQGTGTLLTFDHTGFPKGEAEHLAKGWETNYWQPLEKLLS